MKAYIAICVVGVFAFDESKELIHYKLFSKNPKEIAEKLKKSETTVIDEEKEIVEELRESYDEFCFDSEKQIPNIKTSISDAAKEILSGKFRQIAVELRWVESQAELNKILADVNIFLTKLKLRETERDKLIIQVIGMIDDLDKVLNLLIERLREWYGLYFPEINDLMKDHEKFLQFVAEKTERELFEKKNFESAGIELSDDDLKTIQKTAKHLLNLYNSRDELNKYLENLANDIAPNTNVIVGSSLTARLIALSGGLEKLAKMPSSTIQLLGAEKALFRFLKGGGKPPKHGIIFQHPLILQAPIPLRGKIARVLASKIAIAARIDCYSKQNKSHALKEDLERSLQRIRNDFKK